MRILSIRFLNLNSLKGEHEICFDRQPLADAGLFAITGPTGAGKTTLLDAITIALYGCVHRHGKDCEESMTRYTGESWSEVRFEAEGRRYRAKWMQKRARGKAEGNLQGAKMELVNDDTNEIIVSHPLAAVKEQIVELCGLDYQQFLRSVMLCQGDFTRFLKANESERSELLEKITDTAIYSEISKFIFDQAKQHRLILEQLQAEMGHVTIFTDEELEGYAGRQSELEAEQAKLVVERNAITESINWWKALQQLEEKKTRAEEELRHWKGEAEANREQLEQLARHEKALTHRSDWREIELLGIRATELQSEVARWTEQITDLEQQYRDAQAGADKASEELKAADERLQKALPKFEQVKALDIQVAAQRAKTDEVGEEVKKFEAEYGIKQFDRREKFDILEKGQLRLNELKRWLGARTHESGLKAGLPSFYRDLERLQQGRTALDKLVEEESILRQQHTDAGKAIEENETRCKVVSGQCTALQSAVNELRDALTAALAGRTVDYWSEQARTLPLRLRLLQEGRGLSATYLQSLSDKNSCETQLQDLELQLAEARKTLQEVLQEKTAADQSLVHLTKIAELQRMIRNYEEDRHKLQPDQPCPLCGATEHPFAEGGYHDELNEAEQARDEQKRICEELAVKVSEESMRIVRQESAGAALQQKIAEAVKAIAQSEKAFAGINRQLETHYVIDAAAALEEAQAQAETACSLATGKLQECQLLETKIRGSENDLQQTKTALSSLDGIKKQLEERRHQLSNQLAEKTKTLTAHTRECGDLENALNFFLAPHELRLDFAALETLRADLQKRCETYQQFADECADLQRKESGWQSEFNNAELAARESEERLADHQVKWTEEKKKLQTLEEERKDLFGAHDPVEARKLLESNLQKAQAAKEKASELLGSLLERSTLAKQQLSGCEAESETNRTLIGKQTASFLTRVQKDGFASIETYGAAFLPEEEVTALSEQRQTITEQQSAAVKLLATLEKEQAALTAQQKVKQSEAELTAALEAIEVRMAELNQEIGRIRGLFEDNRKRNDRLSKIMDEVNEAKRETDRWEKLSSLVGAHDGKRFRTFAQSLTLTHLTGLANRHLKKFSDRYLIIKSPDKDLELLIQDAYQADAVRPVTTLSGGESFLVSLALALGLSDLAGRRTRIDSLFIDEGFGTLDADTLDVAITALENLQASGKMIGVISHVEALKDRIGVRIEVRKEAGGHSKVKVKGYGALAGDKI